MKIITRKEWEKTPKDYKRIYDDSLYMVYKDNDGSTYFGPVRIAGRVHSIYSQLKGNVNKVF